MAHNDISTVNEMMFKIDDNPTSTQTGNQQLPVPTPSTIFDCNEDIKETDNIRMLDILSRNLEIFENSSLSVDDIDSLQIIIDIQTIPIASQLSELQRNQRNMALTLNMLGRDQGETLIRSLHELAPTVHGFVILQRAVDVNNNANDERDSKAMKGGNKSFHRTYACNLVTIGIQ